jgi:hypothetical protein
MFGGRYGTVRTFAEGLVDGCDAMEMAGREEPGPAAETE